jgi:hypothetical protein
VKAVLVMLQQCAMLVSGVSVAARFAYSVAETAHVNHAEQRGTTYSGAISKLGNASRGVTAYASYTNNASATRSTCTRTDGMLSKMPYL